MAVTWEVKITLISLATKEVSVVATRTDSLNVDNPRSYTVPRAMIATSAQKLAVMDEIWEKYQDSLAKESVIAEFVNELETQAKSNLEAREI